MGKKGSGSLAPSRIGVKEILTKELHPNPHNPRLLFDKGPLRVLTESIAKVGILVPLTVYREVRSGKFVILDGQRRWIAAQNLGLKTIPINEVAEPDLVQNIVTMFQIHKLREDWELMPTALKLEILMAELQERNEKKLGVLTGLDPAVVSRCKKLLDYPRRYQDLMLDPDPSGRVKADFFIELYAVRNDRFVNSLDWFSRDMFTEKMLARYRSRSGIKAVTDFRTIKQYISNARRAARESEIAARLEEFVADESLGLDHLIIRDADLSAKARKLETDIVNLRKVLADLDVKSYYGEEVLWKELEELLRVIERRLEHAGRRFR